MVRIEQVAEAALAGDALGLRSLAQDWLRAHPRLVEVRQPDSMDSDIRVIAAGLVKLFAVRRNETAPGWVHGIGAARSPIFLVRGAATMKRLRELCEKESPEPLRRRKLFAPPTFLEFA